MSSDQSSRRVGQILDGREWWDVRMSANVARQNREKMKSKWCMVCGQSAAEHHGWRFHQAGGVLAGPFCGEWCAWMFLMHDDVPDETHSPADIRQERRVEA